MNKQIVMANKNPNKEIYYFVHLEKPIGYILLSTKMSVDDFFELFAMSEIIEDSKKFDELVKLRNLEIVIVGD